jgi:hypothetical protein
VTVLIQKDRIWLQGNCGADDVELLMSGMRLDGSAMVDLSEADHLHTAILQVLLAFRPSITGTPRDSFIRTWLIPVLVAERTSRQQKTS